ncbi:MAG: thiamine-monophosphate kinase [marine bacterium B5-7]|nr:MAG: thiamine-monophosphate kinase [marine bacterium B5-7]
MNEFDLIDRFFRSKGTIRDEILIGIGDDAAVIAPSDSALVLCSDTLVSGVHFADDERGSDVGYKCLGVNLSDLAAMGAEPVFALLNLTLPSFNDEWLDDFVKGFNELACRFNVSLIGGDTTHGPLSVTVQAGGRVPVELPGQISLLRSNADVGDEIYIGGPVGDGFLGLEVASGRYDSDSTDADYLLNRLRRPLPQVELGLAVRSIAASAIDISDGLIADLGHILKSSGCLGASLDLNENWFSKSARRYLDQGGDPVKLISGGDDYILCLTVRPENVDKFHQACKRIDADVRRIGRVVDSSGIRITDDNDRLIDASRCGYRHFD